MTTLSTTHDAISDLRARVAGPVLTAADDGYDAARTGFDLTHVSKPGLIVVAERADDVAEAVRFAAARRLPVSVQGTGHGPGPAADGSLMIVTGRLVGVVVDPQTRTARIQAGTKWGLVLEAAQQHGLAPLLGSSSDVGVVGYTLGGGFASAGWVAVSGSPPIASAASAS